MSENRAVSIVIPTYNGAATIATQLGRLIPQLLDGDEIIVANNRSTDDTVHVVEELAKKDPRIRTVPAVGRQGINHARNAGINHARNQFILFCDDDDAVADTWVADMREGLRKWPVVGGRFRLMVVGEQVTDILDHPHAFGYSYPTGGSMGVRRAVFERVGTFDESFVRGHDEVEFGIRVQLAGYEVGNSDALITYVQRSAPKSAYLQHFHFGRTYIQLWCRYRNSIDPGAVSLTSAVRRAIPLVVNLLPIYQNRGGLQRAKATGWQLGAAWGHLRYRILFGPPKPLIGRIRSQKMTKIR